MSSLTEPDFIGRCQSPWEMTQGAAEWLARRCSAEVAAVYLPDDGPGQVRRGLHVPGGGILAPLTTLLPHRLWWKGPASWTSEAGPSMRIVPFPLGPERAVAVVGPFDLARPRDPLAVTIDAAVRRLAAPLAAGLDRFPSARTGRTDLLAAVAFQFGASLDGSPDPILHALREVLGADRVGWEDGRVVVEGAQASSAAAVAAAEWWLPLVDAAGPGLGDPRSSDRGADDHDADDRDAVGVVLSGLADVLDARHPATRGRSLATAELAIRMGARLRLGPDRLAEVEEVACLHRLGTALLDSYPDAPAGVREHPRLATVTASLLDGAGRSRTVVEGVRALAERWDGAGPESRAGMAIPGPARIVAVATSWLELITAAWHPEGTVPVHGGGDLVERRAARDLVSRAGTELDPRVVGALLEETDASAALQG